jgi:putative transposase
LIKTQEFKIYNNKKVLKIYDNQISICRKIYNLSKEIDECYYNANKKISCFDLQKQLTEAKKEFEWIKQVDSTVLQNTIERYFKAKDNFFANHKSGKISKLKAKYIEKQKKNNLPISNKKLYNIGKPKWAKKNEYQTLNYKSGIKVRSNGFYVPKFGILQVFNFKYYKGDKIKTCSITKKADGLYIQIQIEVEEVKKPINFNDSQVGIDMGISYFLTTSDGEFVDNPKHLFKALKKLRIANRKASRRYDKNLKKQSNNFYKAMQDVKRIHKNVADCRKDFLHKVSTNLSNNYSTIFHEDLNVSGMVQSKLSKHISDVSWSKFFDLLKYKTNTIRVNPAYTSQKCNNCGHTCKDNRKTQSIFECISCGFSANADENGAKNILELGTSSVSVNVKHRLVRSSESRLL